ncbi:Kinase-like protein [Mycena sanguinolenta]|uniref:Kinase-like protein n=1 Tax=Mycena sanguinolenta TaxID=230812 RepID=A0A8H6X8I1_9AGAR|nr:Kinase-like protein [Mycena sanguinolenta]
MNDRDEHPTFGGEFSDVDQASYQGKRVALTERLRTFTADSTPHRTRLKFHKEALIAGLGTWIAWSVLLLVAGLDYLHSMDVVHGDLRGTNILISNEGNASLSDFGLATSIEDADSTTAGVTTSSNRAGSVRWFAPELIDPTRFGCTKFIRTKASDVYAYACVCLELYTRNPPGRTMAGGDHRMGAGFLCST